MVDTGDMTKDSTTGEADAICEVRSPATIAVAAAVSREEWSTRDERWGDGDVVNAVARHGRETRRISFMV